MRSFFRFYGNWWNLSIVLSIWKIIQRTIYTVNNIILVFFFAVFSFLQFFLFSYIGAGDSKVFPKLVSDPPYQDVSITKIEDVNHFSKKMLHCLQKMQTLKLTEFWSKIFMESKYWPWIMSLKQIFPLPLKIWVLVCISSTFIMTIKTKKL